MYVSTPLHLTVHGPGAEKDESPPILTPTEQALRVDTKKGEKSLLDVVETPTTTQTAFPH